MPKMAKSANLVAFVASMMLLSSFVSFKGEETTPSPGLDPKSNQGACRYPNNTIDFPPNTLNGTIVGDGIILPEHPNWANVLDVVRLNIVGGILTRDETLKVLRTAEDILLHQHRITSDRYQVFSEQARNLVRFLTGDLSLGSTSSSSVDLSPRKKQKTDIDFNSTDPAIIARKPPSLATRRNIVELASKGRSETQIRKQYGWYRRQYLHDYIDQINAGGSAYDKRQAIENAVAERVRESAKNLTVVTGDDILTWADQEAAARGYGRNYRFGTAWLFRFQKRYAFSSRKITKRVGSAQLSIEEQISASIEEFYTNYTRISPYVRPRLIWNVDQTAFNYEQSRDRTITNKGSRDVIIRADSLNKLTHSYTVQPMISRDGKVIGKLLICLQEPKGYFGSRIRNEVEELERQYGNVKVIASKSGKMSKELIRVWEEEVLMPASSDHQNSREYDAPTANYDPHWIDGDQDELVGFDDLDRACYRNNLPRFLRDECNLSDEPIAHSSRDPRFLPVPETRRQRQQYLRGAPCMEEALRDTDQRCLTKPKQLLLMDQWTGQREKEFLERLKNGRINVVDIPKHTTADLQPLDVTFNRQLKYLANRITHQAHIDGLIRNITSRSGIINLQSLMWNQLGASSFWDMIRYAWHNTDPDFSTDELVHFPPRMVKDVNFDFNRTDKCEVQGCPHHAFIRCAHCGKKLCLKHFLERLCFHEVPDDTNELTNDIGSEGTEIYNYDSDYTEIYGGLDDNMCDESVENGSQTTESDETEISDDDYDQNSKKKSNVILRGRKVQT